MRSTFMAWIAYPSIAVLPMNESGYNDYPCVCVVCLTIERQPRSDLHGNGLPEGLTTPTANVALSLSSG